MKSKELIELTEKFGAKNYLPLPIVIAKAEGVWVTDPEGNKYLDCLSSYSALNQGHCHKRIIGALTDQASKCTLTSRAFHNDQLGPFLKLITEVCDMEMALPMNTGAEAVETAIKTVRKWGYTKKGVELNKAEIIVFDDNFHGRTISIVSFSTEKEYKKYFGPFTPGFKTVAYGDIDALKNAITKNTVAIMGEPIQGEAGVVEPKEGFYQEVRKLCDENNILLVADEIQTGLGRTGKMFCMEHYDVKPDMYILGKALGGGVLPISAVVSSSEIMSVFIPGEHGSTFGGNPLACRVAIEAIAVLKDENLVKNSYELGNYFMDLLKTIKSPHIESLRGRGLLIGIVLKESAKGARRFCEALKDKGLLCKETHDHVIRFAPPLVITKDEIDWCFERIKDVLENLD
ncbi:MAG: ornithine--oxo-acid transaminase [Candidatus Cloacimonadota bacterium]|nr:MAG: ornithine--oxo-acid transaminase [Candidatus Cloacimonadota bacterium]